jgi:hypothetical protein
MPELEPNVDAYGSRARASALADFVELWAIAGVHPSAADVGDYIDDVGWTRRLHELYEPAPTGERDDPEELGEDETTAARRVFDLLRERKAVLEERWPFGFDGQRLRFRNNEGTRAYLLALAISIAHAYEIDVPAPPEVVFESVVARVLTSCARRAVNFSEVRARCKAEHGGFDAAITAACGTVGLRATPEARVRPVWANDENVDTIVHLDWGDGRSGAWTMVGQVTCAKSDAWEGKLQEVPVHGWGLLLGELIEPQGFLAVPHHIERRHLYYLVQGHKRLVVDRLRTALWLDGPTPDEQELIEAVLNVPLTGL